MSMTWNNPRLRNLFTGPKVEALGSQEISDHEICVAIRSLDPDLEGLGIAHLLPLDEEIYETIFYLDPEFN